MIISQTDSELKRKQIALNKAISAEAESSNSESESESNDDSDFDGDEEYIGRIDNFEATVQNSRNIPVVQEGEEEEKQ